jgi:hypothetical protein
VSEQAPSAPAPLEPIHELIVSWREHARRVRPLETAPLTADKRKRTGEYIHFTARAIELEAALSKALSSLERPQNTDLDLRASQELENLTLERRPWELIRDLRNALRLSSLERQQGEEHESQPVQPCVDQSERSANSAEAVRPIRRAESSANEAGSDLPVSELQANADAERVGLSSLERPPQPKENP